MKNYLCRYESLVARPAEEITRLLAYLNLPWREECLAFHKTKRVVATASYGQVYQSLYAGSVGRYRNYQSNLTDILNDLHSVMLCQGYES